MIVENAKSLEILLRIRWPIKW